MSPDLDPRLATAVETQLVTLTVTVTSMEKTLERGLEAVGKRLDRLEDRQAMSERQWAVINSRVEMLEERGRGTDRVDAQRGRDNERRMDQLTSDNQRFTVWQVILGAVLGTISVIGVIAGVATAVHA